MSSLPGRWLQYSYVECKLQSIYSNPLRLPSSSVFNSSIARHARKAGRFFCYLLDFNLLWEKADLSFVSNSSSHTWKLCEKHHLLDRCTSVGVPWRCWFPFLTASSMQKNYPRKPVILACLLKSRVKLMQECMVVSMAGTSVHLFKRSVLIFWRRSEFSQGINLILTI